MLEHKKPYDKAADVLRILAIFAVITIHSTTKTIQISHNNLIDFSFSLFLNQIARFAVPMFFLISGFVLELNYHFHKNYFEYLKRRVSKLFIPYFVWSLFYYLLIFKNQSENFISALIYGAASYQLYFIPSLFIFYLIFPYMHKYYKVFTKPVVIIPLGIIQLSILAFDYFVRPLPPYFPLSVALFNYFAFISGMIAANNFAKIKSFFKRFRWITGILAIIFAFVVFFEGRNGYLETHNYLSFYSQWRPSVLIYTLIISGVIYYYSSKSSLSEAIIKKLSSLSFFVFFVHVSILEYAWKIFGYKTFPLIQPNEVTRVVFDLTMLLIVTLSSFLLAEAAHKIPYLSKLTG